MISGILIFCFMAISALYSLLKWANYKKNLDVFLSIHCVAAMFAFITTVIHVILNKIQISFSVEYISLFSMLGALITGIPLKIVFKDKPKYIRFIWPFHIGFAIAFIVSCILHIVMVIAL